MSEWTGRGSTKASIKSERTETNPPLSEPAKFFLRKTMQNILELLKTFLKKLTKPQTSIFNHAMTTRRHGAPFVKDFTQRGLRALLPRLVMLGRSLPNLQILWQS